MESMIALLVLLIVAVFGLLPLMSFIILLGLNGKVSKLEAELKSGLAALHARLAEKRSPAAEPVEEPPAAPVEPKVEPVVAPQPVFTPPPAPMPKPTPMPEPKPVKKPEPVPAPACKTVESQPSEFERNATEAIKRIWNWILVGEEREGVSLEYAVATTWLTRGAIIIILAALAFGINYSIKNGLIGPHGRVAMSFGAGLFMTCWGLWLAKGNYRTAAQGLIGGGMAALYFSSFASSMIYHLISPLWAFGLMGLVTAACCVVAMSLDSLLIALIGTLGGYLTPVLLSTGEKNLPGLFAYLVMLGVGLLFVARKRDWKLLNALSLLFTYGLYFAALGKFYDKAVDYPVALGFGVAFFLIFSLSPLLYNIIHRKASTALELIQMLVNSVAFFAGAHMLTVAKFPDADAYAAAISLSLAAYNILFAALLHKRGIGDKSLLNMLYAFASFFVAFSVPLLLGSQWIGAAWSLQALAMLWLARRLGGSFLPFLAYALYCVAGVRMVFFDLPGDFGHMDKAKYFAELPGRVGSFASFIGSLAGAWLLMRGAKEDAQPERDVSLGWPMGAVFLAGSIAALFLYLHLEFNFMASTLLPEMKAPLLSAIWTVALLLSLHQWLKSGSKFAAGLSAFFGVGLIVKLFLMDLALFDFSLERLVFGDGPLSMRLLDFAPAIAALFAGFVLTRGKGDADKAQFFATGFLIVLFSYLTLEIKTLTALTAPGFSSGAVSVFWGLFALAMLFTGIRRKVPALRLAGLILFLVTGVKIFMLDLASLSQLARIGAFFALGVATLAGAFVYMRFRSVFEDAATQKDGGKP